MAAQKEAFHQASPTEAFLLNCWYVAAWDHELIDGRLLIHRGRILLGEQRIHLGAEVGDILVQFGEISHDGLLVGVLPEA